jgi:hypothetical protein
MRTSYGYTCDFTCVCVLSPRPFRRPESRMFPAYLKTDAVSDVSGPRGLQVADWLPRLSTVDEEKRRRFLKTK